MTGEMKMGSAAVVAGSGTDRLAGATAQEKSTPRRRDSLRCRSFDDEAVLYDVAHNAVHYLNRTAYFIWSRCDGRHGLEELVGMVAEAFDMGEAGTDPVDTVRRDVVDTLSELAANGLIDSDSRMNHDSACGAYRV